MFHIFAGLLLNCNWAIVSDMTLYIVIPTRRSLASATQILFSHALGDAISPYLVGVFADWIRPAITPQGTLLPPLNSPVAETREVREKLVIRSNCFNKPNSSISSGL